MHWDFATIFLDCCPRGAWMPDNAQIVTNVRQASGIPAGQGPEDEHIATAVRAFADKFNYWYGRVMRKAVPKYRTNIIGRINPLVRRMEHQGGDCLSFAKRVV